MRNGDAVPVGEWIVEERKKTASGEVLFERESGEIGDRRIDVNELDNARTGLTISFCARGADDEGGAGPLFKHGALLPDAMVFSKVVAVIGPEDDDGILSKAETVEFGEHATDLGIDEGDAGEVGLEAFEEVGLFDIVIRDGVIVSESGGGNIVAVAIGCVGKAELFDWVEVEIFLGCDER